MTVLDSSQKEKAGLGAHVLFEKLSEPGAYLSNWSGHLLRIPQDALPKQSPVIKIIGKDKMVVTKLADDPLIPLDRARSLAADLGMPVNF